MSHGLGPLLQYRENGLRQWAGPNDALFNDFIHFTVKVGSLVNTLGENNGHGGMVTTLAGWDHAPGIHFEGFGPGTDWVFDHFAGKYEGGKLVTDHNQAYYHVIDPSNHANDGYILLTGHIEVPTNLVFG